MRERLEELDIVITRTSLILQAIKPFFAFCSFSLTLFEGKKITEQAGMECGKN